MKRGFLLGYLLSYATDEEMIRHDLECLVDSGTMDTLFFVERATEKYMFTITRGGFYAVQVDLDIKGKRAFKIYCSFRDDAEAVLFRLMFDDEMVDITNDISSI